MSTAFQVEHASRSSRIGMAVFAVVSEPILALALASMGS